MANDYTNILAREWEQELEIAALEQETTMALLQTVHPSNTESALAARIAELEAQLAAKSNRALSFKVSEKGCLAVYGLGRFPVVQYISTWEKLWAAQDEMKAFAKANASKLARKG